MMKQTSTNTHTDNHIYHSGFMNLEPCTNWIVCYTGTKLCMVQNVISTLVSNFLTVMLCGSGLCTQHTSSEPDIYTDTVAGATVIITGLMG